MVNEEEMFDADAVSDWIMPIGKPEQSDPYKVEKVTFSGKVVAVFDSIKDAELKSGYTSSYLRRNFFDGVAIAHSFIWRQLIQ